MKGAFSVAAAATVGNLLQGWDSGAVAGALLYLKPEFHLEDKPTIEGIVVASTLIGAVLSTTCAGPAADWLGRRAILSISGFIYSIGGCVMSWSPNVYVLILGRLLIGAAIGLASTISPIFISESAPTEIRGQLSTLPQLSGSGGMFLAYSMAFGLSLMGSPNWRFMLGIIVLPSLLYLLLAIFYLPESPRWLVSKGRMLDAKQVLQRLRNKEDVGAELALLVEGLGSGDESFEEYIIQPGEIIGINEKYSIAEEGQIQLYGPDRGLSWIAKSITEESGLHGLTSRSSSMEPHSLPLIDPIVTLMGSLRTNALEHVPAYLEDNGTAEEWDEENALGSPVANGYLSDDAVVGELDEHLATPLLRRRTSEKLEAPVPRNRSRSSLHSHGSIPPSSMPYGSSYHGSIIESFGSTGNIGGGWQLAWQWTRPEGSSKPDVGSFKRVYLLQEGSTLSRAPSQVGNRLSLPSLIGVEEPEIFQAAALVGHPAQSGYLFEGSVGPAMVHPAETAVKGPVWSDILEPGVRRALVVGCSLQILQQFCGINAVLYYTLQILQASGADVLLARIGIGANSSSILASGVSCLLMLPCITIAMRLMDRSGRRQLLLATLPILVISLVAVVLTNVLLSEGLIQAAVSFSSVATFICCFVTGFGPIPNIICSEIFPTRARGVCIGICSACMWTCNVIVSYSFPAMKRLVGLQGVFGLFAAVSCVSWVFVFLKVPETKGIPLEVISEFFAISSREGAEARSWREKEAREVEGGGCVM